MGVIKNNFSGSSSKKLKGFTPTSNPALSYVQDSYGFDAGIFIKLSKMVHAHSESAAREFAELIQKKHSDDSIHFFFDYFLSFYFMIAKPNTLPGNKNSISAIINGMHIEYYGNVSGQEVRSLIDLYICVDPCFFKSFLRIIPQKDRHRLTIPMAAWSVNKNLQLEATQVLELIPGFQNIQNSKLSSIDAGASVILS